MAHLHYFIRRLLLIIPTWLGICISCFCLCLLIPGGPVEQRMAQMQGTGAGIEGGSASGTDAVSNEQKEQLEKQFHFDKLIRVQIWIWLWDDNLGLTRESYKYPGETAWELIKDTFPISLTFGITSFILFGALKATLGLRVSEEEEVTGLDVAEHGSSGYGLEAVGGG